MAKPNSRAPLGQGGRFAAMEQKLSQRKGVYDPAGLAAYIGRKNVDRKYGAGTFQGLATKGRKRHHKKHA